MPTDDPVRLRRAYQAETRRMVAEVRSRAEAVADADAARLHAMAVLELAPRLEPSDVLPRLRARLPGLLDAGPASDASRFDRAAVEGALREVEAEQHRLEQEARTCRAYVHQLDRGEQALRAGEVREALGAVEDVCRDLPSSGRARTLLAAVRVAAAAAEAARQSAEPLVQGVITTESAEDLDGNDAPGVHRAAPDASDPPAGAMPPARGRRWVQGSLQWLRRRLTTR
jgi:hypothetical protein